MFHFDPICLLPGALIGGAIATTVSLAFAHFKQVQDDGSLIVAAMISRLFYLRYVRAAHEVAAEDRAESHALERWWTDQSIAWRDKVYRSFRELSVTGLQRVNYLSDLSAVQQQQQPKEELASESI